MKMNYNFYVHTLNILKLVRDESNNTSMDNAAIVLTKHTLNDCVNVTLECLNVGYGKTFKDNDSMLKELKVKKVMSEEVVTQGLSEIDKSVLLMSLCLNILDDFTTENKAAISCKAVKDYDFYFSKDKLYFTKHDRIVRRLHLQNIDFLTVYDALQQEKIFTVEEAFYLTNKIIEGLDIQGN